MNSISFSFGKHFQWFRTRKCYLFTYDQIARTRNTDRICFMAWSKFFATVC